MSLHNTWLVTYAVVHVHVPTHLYQSNLWALCGWFDLWQNVDLKVRTFCDIYGRLIALMSYTCTCNYYYSLISLLQAGTSFQSQQLNLSTHSNMFPTSATPPITPTSPAHSGTIRLPNTCNRESTPLISGRGQKKQRKRRLPAQLRHEVCFRLWQSKVKKLNWSIN